MAKMLLRKELVDNMSGNTEYDYHEGTYGNLGRRIASVRVRTMDGEQYVEVDFPLWDYKDPHNESNEWVNIMITPKGKWAGKKTTEEQRDPGDETDYK